MKSANPLKEVFQSNDDVKAARHALHETIVDSVNDMLLLTAKKEHSCKYLPKILVNHNGGPRLLECLLVFSYQGAV
jgi:hypothetical protein